MATTDPLTGSTIYQQTDAATGGTQLGDIVRDLRSFTVPRFSSSATRDTGYASFVSDGGTMADGMVSTTTDTAGGLWLRKSGAWRLELSDTGWSNLSPNSPFVAGAGGARYKVLNRVCYFQMDLLRNTSAWTDPVSVLTFPSGARPAFSQYFFALRQGVSAEVAENLTIASTGVMTLGVSGAAGDHVYASGCFPID